MKENDPTDGLAAIGSLVLPLPVIILTAAKTGSTFLGLSAGALLLVNAIRLLCRSGG